MEVTVCCRRCVSDNDFMRGNIACSDDVPGGTCAAVGEHERRTKQDEIVYRSFVLDSAVCVSVGHSPSVLS